MLENINLAIRDLEAMRAELIEDPSLEGNEHWRANLAQVGYGVYSSLEY